MSYTCNSRVKINDYLPVKTRVVLNQLSRLRMKCLVSEQVNIEDREKHKNICSKKIISCTSADLKCSFTPIRPIIDQLKDQLEIIQKTQIEQQCLIQAYVNKGHTLSHDCTVTSCIAKNCICNYCFQKHTQKLKSLTLKRKLPLSSADIDDDNSLDADEMERYLINRYGPNRDAINAEDEDDDDDYEFIVDS